MPIISRLRPFTFVLPALSLLVFLGEPLPAQAESEEPDYAFLTGGPYTQQRGQIQFISSNFWGRRTSAVDGAELRHTQFDAALRTEWGLTDRWELDLVCGGSGERRRAAGSLLESSFAATDTLLGARYRFLREPAAPLTLTMGPQVILPTGDPQYGTGHKRVGVAWDVAAAKDWGGPAFLFSAVNYALLPSVRDRAQVNSREFHLHSIFGAFALGLRPIEKRREDSHHDLHLFLELGAGRAEILERGATGPFKHAQATALFAPGMRYGLRTRRGKLFEIGLSFPRGLNDATPRAGIIVQVQFEQTLLARGE